MSVNSSKYPKFLKSEKRHLNYSTSRILTLILVKLYMNLTLIRDKNYT